MGFCGSYRPRQTWPEPHGELRHECHTACPWPRLADRLAQQVVVDRLEQLRLHGVAAVGNGPPDVEQDGVHAELAMRRMSAARGEHQLVLGVHPHAGDAVLGGVGRRLRRGRDRSGERGNGDECEREYPSPADAHVVMVGGRPLRSPFGVRAPRRPTLTIQGARPLRSPVWAGEVSLWSRPC